MSVNEKKHWVTIDVNACPHTVKHAFFLQELVGHYEDGCKTLFPASKYTTRVVYGYIDSNGKLVNLAGTGPTIEEDEK